MPQRRLGEPAKYGMRADASALRRHGGGRRLATLLATIRFLEGKWSMTPWSCWIC
ncbi:hypothetical protein [Nonomuraea roseoviolacea]|uniref:Uncharacterized protein n=1 Tax=Nonomuraea roseoviolacea subsp. carminata TaxID=160689 RepID=A0ABT1KCN4_9ACTN|nr:hypothetical protein [Nonomuraea roseoviolacea]MCP2351731.1 hypothetical protein [Nonomuraea roseoviolacea subsp. carminata]